MFATATSRSYRIRVKQVGRECQRKHFVAFAARLLPLSANLVRFSRIGTGTKPTLTLDLPKTMAVACQAKAKQERWELYIAVLAGRAGRGEARPAVNFG